MDLFYNLQSKWLVDFSVYFRKSETEVNWLQVEYYSNKLKKTIILDYDFNDTFEDVEEIMEEIKRINKEIEFIENKTL